MLGSAALSTAPHPEHLQGIPRASPTPRASPEHPWSILDSRSIPNPWGIPGASPSPRAAAAQGHPPAGPPGRRAPGTHHVPLLHAVAALEHGGPGGRLSGRGGDVALRAPQQRVGGHVAALPAVPPILQGEQRVTGAGRAGRGIPCQKAGRNRAAASPERSAVPSANCSAWAPAGQ